MSINRPDSSEIQAVYDDIFHTGPYISRNKLKDAAINARLFRVQPQAEDYRVPGRSIAWKVFLIPTSEDDLAAASERPNPDSVLEYLQEKRSSHEAALRAEMKAPDGSWMDGFAMDSTEKGATRTSEDTKLETNNPLSLDAENPWKEYFSSLDTLRTIKQDVERIFPDIPFFASSVVQKDLTAVLFVFTQTNPDLGYRQGMHELAACLYMGLDYDSLPSSIQETPVERFCSRRSVAADTAALLSLLLSPRGSQLRRWYEWRESSPFPLVHSGPAKPYISPVVETSNSLQNIVLKTIDPLLYESLRESGVEGTIYAIRWLRMVFTREFSMHEAMLLWDGIFAADPSFEICIWIAAAMLIRIRNKLISSDYSTQLTNLLRYPPSPSPVTSNTHHITVLLRQAIALRETPTALTGAAMVYENRNVLGIDADVPGPEIDPRRRERGTRGTSLGGGGNGQGLPELIARGLIEKGEIWGVNRTVLSAVSEIRRNLPANLTQTLNGRSTTSNISSDAMSNFSRMSSIKNSNATGDNPRPPWEPRTRFEIERELVSIRASLKSLSAAVGSAVDVLLQSEDDADKQRAEKVQRKEALERLDYVREVLGKSAIGDTRSLDIDEERLWGEEEAGRRRENRGKERLAKHDGLVKETQEPAVQQRVITDRIAPPSRVAKVERTELGSHTQRQHQLEGRLFVRDSDVVAPPAMHGNAPVLSPTRHSQSASMPTLQPPWNHSPSTFASSNKASPEYVTPYTLPRLPPLASSNVAPSRSRGTWAGDGHSITDTGKPPEVNSDPLGAIR